jgi:hypothetical protein
MKIQDETLSKVEKSLVESDTSSDKSGDNSIV